MLRAALVLVALLLVAATPAVAAGPIGVITELSVANGSVDVRPAGGDWRPAKPLLSVFEGDQVRASGAGRAVLVLEGASRPAVITAATSPYVAAAPAQPGLSDRVRAAVGFLQSTPREATRRDLTVRSGHDMSRLVILAPRDTLVAADRVDLEWVGPDMGRYTVRVATADGRVLWEKKQVTVHRIALAPGEVSLPPGQYRCEVESTGELLVIKHAAFDVATPEATAQARAVTDAVARAGYPGATDALLKAAGLMRERFHADARRELLRGLEASPDEPALHLLLADVYERTGLANLAAAEYDRADALSSSR